MRLRFAKFVSFWLVNLSLALAGTPVITNSSPTSRDVRLMDRLQSTVIASDPDGHALTYLWQFAADPTGRAYFVTEDAEGVSFLSGPEFPACKVAFPWAGPDDALNQPYIGKTAKVKVTVGHLNVADGAGTVALTFEALIVGINHPPVPVITGRYGTPENRVQSGDGCLFSSGDSYDPDPGDSYRSDWSIGYRAGGWFTGNLVLFGSEGSSMSFTVPDMTAPINLQVLLRLTDGMHQVYTSVIAYLKPAPIGPPPPPPPPELNERLYFAQVGVGALDGGALQTIAVLVNPTVEEALVKPVLLDADGQPSVIPILVDGVAWNGENVRIEPGTSIRLKFAGDVPTAAQLEIQSDKVLTGMLVYQTIAGGVVLDEVSLYPSISGLKFRTDWEKGETLAVAVANKNTSSVELGLRVLNRDGAVVQHTQFLNVKAGGHAAVHLTDLDNLLLARGTVVIESTHPVYLTLLKTQNGGAFAAVPIALGASLWIEIN